MHADSAFRRNAIRSLPDTAVAPIVSMSTTVPAPSPPEQNEYLSALDVAHKQAMAIQAQRLEAMAAHTPPSPAPRPPPSLPPMPPGWRHISGMSLGKERRHAPPPQFPPPPSPSPSPAVAAAGSGVSLWPLFALLALVAVAWLASRRRYHQKAVASLRRAWMAKRGGAFEPVSGGEPLGRNGGVAHEFGSAGIDETQPQAPTGAQFAIDDGSDEDEDRYGRALPAAGPVDDPPEDGDDELPAMCFSATMATSSASEPVPTLPPPTARPPAAAPHMLSLTTGTTAGARTSTGPEACSSSDGRVSGNGTAAPLAGASADAEEGSESGLMSLLLSAPISLPGKGMGMD